MRDGGLSILCIGSPFGDDRVGWLAAERLATQAFVRDNPDRVRVRQLDRPGSLLIAEFVERASVILIDALRSGAAPGTIHRLNVEALCALPVSISSHGLGVAQAVGLARQLGCLPGRLVCFGVEIAGDAPGHAVSAAILAAVPPLVDRVITQVEVWLACASGADGVDRKEFSRPPF